MSHSVLGEQFRVPLPPGESPIPEGHDRYYHQTDPSNVPSIRQQGLLWDKGRGIEGPKGVWVSNKPFYANAHDLATVEMSLPHDDRRGRIASIGDVPPDRIVAIHEPWHSHARFMEENEDVKRHVLSGEHDDLMDDASYGPAIKYIKKKYGYGLRRRLVTPYSLGHGRPRTTVR